LIKKRRFEEKKRKINLLVLRKKEEFDEK